MNELTEMITEYWEEHGFTRETTQNILRDIKEALLEQAIVVEIIVVADDNDYDLIDE
jgi:hypothetical protein